MTASEYQQLVEFLAPRFDEVRDRLVGVETRLSSVQNRLGGVENRLTPVETRLARLEVMFEEARHQTEVVAGGITALNRRLDRFQEDVAE